MLSLKWIKLRRTIVQLLDLEIIEYHLLRILFLEYLCRHSLYPVTTSGNQKKKNRSFLYSFSHSQFHSNKDATLENLNEFHSFRLPIDWLEFNRFRYSMLFLTLTITVIKIPSQMRRNRKISFPFWFSILLSSRSPEFLFLSPALIFYIASKIISVPHLNST